MTRESKTYNPADIEDMQKIAGDSAQDDYFNAYTSALKFRRDRFRSAASFALFKLPPGYCYQFDLDSKGAYRSDNVTLVYPVKKAMALEKYKRSDIESVYQHESVAILQKKNNAEERIIRTAITNNQKKEMHELKKNYDRKKKIAQLHQLNWREKNVRALTEDGYFKQLSFLLLQCNKAAVSVAEHATRARLEKTIMGVIEAIS